MSLMLLLTGCSQKSQTQEPEQTEIEAQEQSQNIGDSEAVTLNIAYQYGLAYAPVIIVQKQELIEKAYKEATGKEVTVVWNQMSSGADINTGISSGGLDVGFMGVAPAITGVTKEVIIRLLL